VIDIDGLPEMRIAGLRLTDVIGAGKVGLNARYTDALELHHPGAVLRNSRAFSGTGTFLSVGHAELKSLHLEGNVLANAAIPTEER
jgi:hypothetical protein